MGFSTEVQTAIYDLLAADAPLLALVVGIYDAVPQAEDSGSTTDFPYITIGEDILNSIDTDDLNIMDCSITIHTWSRYRGRKEIKEIQDQVYSVLQKKDFIQNSFKFVNIDHSSATSFLDADGQTRHGVQEFNLLIQEL